MVPPALEPKKLDLNSLKGDAFLQNGRCRGEGGQLSTIQTNSAMWGGNDNPARSALTDKQRRGEKMDAFVATVLAVFCGLSHCFRLTSLQSNIPQFNVRRAAEPG